VSESTSDANALGSDLDERELEELRQATMATLYRRRDQADGEALAAMADAKACLLASTLCEDTHEVNRLLDEGQAQSTRARVAIVRRNAFALAALRLEDCGGHGTWTTVHRLEELRSALHISSSTPSAPSSTPSSMPSAPSSIEPSAPPAATLPVSDADILAEAARENAELEAKAAKQRAGLESTRIGAIEAIRAAESAATQASELAP
jgi:hypothetical protein